MVGSPNIDLKRSNTLPCLHSFLLLAAIKLTAYFLKLVIVILQIKAFQVLLLLHFPSLPVSCQGSGYQVLMKSDYQQSC